jgi:membrane protein implicated in regulation of membrane protease activity
MKWRGGGSVGLAGYVVPLLLSGGAAGAFLLPLWGPAGWAGPAVGVVLLAAQVVWLWRFVRRLDRRAAEQEERHDRRRQLLSTLAH